MSIYLFFRLNERNLIDEKDLIQALASLNTHLEPKNKIKINICLKNLKNLQNIKIIN